MTSGAEAVEHALKLAFAHKARIRRGGRPWSAEELAGVMQNAQSSANELEVISFEGGFHGRTLGALSATRSKPIHKLDFPAFAWPVVPFPASRFPLDEHAAANGAAEAAALEQVDAVLRTRGERVAALIVEPIQGEGGDRHASPEFFRALRAACTAHQVAFVVDEVQTGAGATGRFWAHQAWDLAEPPDVVTWSKKLQLGGLFFREALFPAEPWRVFNTFLGDPLRVAQLAVILEVIERDCLVEHTRRVGERLLAMLRELAARRPDQLSQPRGAGTFAAIDLPDGRRRDRALELLRQRGVEAGGSGDRSIRFRPALVFRTRHAEEATQALDDVAGALAAAGPA